MKTTLARFSRTLVASLLASGPATAQAYCRSRGSDPEVSSCPEACGEDGVPLAWETTDIRYALDEASFPPEEGAALRSILQSSFDTWASVTCDGAPTELRFTAAEEPVSIAERLAKRESEERRPEHDNVIAYLSADEWHELGLGSEAYAITAVRFGASGAIHGADILFNGGKGPLGSCAESGCSGSPWKNDLANIATHEIGHFLGLSHSDVPSATMYCSARAGETSKRDLDSDDVAGLCEIYPPEAPPTKFRIEVSPGCAPRAPESAAPGRALGLLLGLFALLLRRRRRP